MSQRLAPSSRAFIQGSHRPFVVEKDHLHPRPSFAHNVKRGGMRTRDVSTPWGPVRKAHIAAAQALYNDLLKRSVDTELALARGRHLKNVSPAAASLLEFWIWAINHERKSWADLLEEE